MWITMFLGGVALTLVFTFFSHGLREFNNARAQADQPPKGRAVGVLFHCALWGLFALLCLSVMDRLHNRERIYMHEWMCDVEINAYRKYEESLKGPPISEKQNAPSPKAGG